MNQVKYKPIVYLEGVRVPVSGVSVSAAVNGQSSIKVAVPPIRDLAPSWEVSDEEPEDEGTRTEYLLEKAGELGNGLEKKAFITASGIQPNSVIHVFIEEDNNGEPWLLAEGRVASVATTISDTSAMVQVQALGINVLQKEMILYMANLTRALGLMSGFSGERAGADSGSSIAQTLIDDGLVDGIKSLLEDACEGTNDYLNLMWRLFRYSQRLAIVNNPKALGYFDESRLDQLISKYFDQIPNQQPIVQLVQYILRFVKYRQFITPKPSFLNAEYDFENGDINKIQSLDIQNPSELKTNDWIMAPQMSFAPPPRCNVIFPNQYAGYTFQESFFLRPTRGYVRTSSTATINEETSSSELIILPDEMSELISEHDVLWSSPEEKYRGQRLAQFEYNKPEYIDEMESDFIKGFMKFEYELLQHRNNSLQLQQVHFMPDLMPGLPTLILTHDKHFLADLDQVVHYFKPKQAPSTECVFSTARYYDSTPPDEETGLWFDHEMFDREHFGTRILPKLIGSNYVYNITHQTVDDGLEDYISAGEARDLGYSVSEEIEDDTLIYLEDYELEENEDEEGGSVESEDLSILAILVKDGMNASEEEETKAAATSIKDAADSIYDEFMGSPDRDMYSYYFGKRMPIGVKQYFQDFYGATCSSDLFSVAGGFTTETNSLNLRDRDTVEKEDGEPIPDDADLGGCFVKEKQYAVLEQCNTLLGMAQSSIAYTIDQLWGDNVEVVGPMPESLITEEAEAPDLDPNVTDNPDIPGGVV